VEYSWLLNILVFIFGYATCRTFYFLKATRSSLKILQISQWVGLFIIVRSLEHFQYARSFRLDIMKRNGDSEHNISAAHLQFESETARFKRRSIAQIIDCHGSFFKPMVDFNDWPTAMRYLEKNRDTVIDFIKGDEK
jgi:hypothetical protein